MGQKVFASLIHGFLRTLCSRNPCIIIWKVWKKYYCERDDLSGQQKFENHGEKICGFDGGFGFFIEASVKKEYNEEKIVSIHGGGWSKPLLYYRGYILMLKTLMERGYKVRTYCNHHNTSAIRFSRSVGFIPYRYTDTKVLMWISERTLKNTVLYKRFYK